MPKKKILIVDDDKNITLYVKRALEKTEQYEVREENQAEHALTAAQEFSPDLVLLDVLMPGAEGGMVAAQIEAHPRFKNVPIVFLTGTLTEEKSGMIGGLPFIAKPVSPETLISTIEQILKGKNK